MRARKHQQRLRETHQRIAALRQSLGKFDYACSGTLLRRMLSCGNPTCRCKQDIAARHGPYYYWGRRRAGKLVHMLLTPAEAEIVRRAIANHRTIQGTLRKLEEETVRMIETKRSLNG
jgi:hypothetical protein